MEEKKIIGMPFKCVLGLNWLLFPFGIVALAVDHAKMTKEEKQLIIQGFVVAGLFTIISIIYNIISSIVWGIASNNGHGADYMNWIGYILSLAMFILVLIPAIQAFMGEFTKVPCAYDLAGKFLGNGEAKPEENTEAKPEENTEAKTEENTEVKPEENTEATEDNKME